MQQEQRRLAAILAADVAGYSRLMAADESGTLARLKQLRTEVIEPKIAQFHGRIVGSAGDSLLIEFASAVNAVQCAVEAQEGLADQNANLPQDRCMAFRMGVNLGDVIPEDDTIHGDGVNIASRSACISWTWRRHRRQRPVAAIHDDRRRPLPSWRATASGSASPRSSATRRRATGSSAARGSRSGFWPARVPNLSPMRPNKGEAHVRPRQEPALHRRQAGHGWPPAQS